MTSAIGCRVESFRNTPLLRSSLNFFRAFSSDSSSTSSSAVSSAQNPKKSKRRKKKNLFEVAQFLPNWGIGYHMAKSHWNEVSYEITKLNLYKDGRHGKAWGIAYKNG
ncbi:Mitochondrial 28S ribosomal protein S34 [Vigna unguiculata]|uniref:Mitochondrial 28S ribosomal protein S34 n=1 Tax=Vigna unguiculata TaxID=3917 RepID=A0A4D6LAR0_VIGUN|nr:Mitochondrial 28S ribosomal protein S34 [Vigna unguiculata]